MPGDVCCVYEVRGPQVSQLLSSNGKLSFASFNYAVELIGNRMSLLNMKLQFLFCRFDFPTQTAPEDSQTAYKFLAFKRFLLGFYRLLHNGSF